jgi:hypothetical protein
MSAQPRSAALALRLAGVALALLVLGAVVSHYGLGANFNLSSTRWRPLLDRRVLRGLIAGALATVRRSSGPITASAGALT